MIIQIFLIKLSATTIFTEQQNMYRISCGLKIFSCSLFSLFLLLLLLPLKSFNSVIMGKISFLKTHFRESNEHRTWSVVARRKENLNEYVSTGICWRHHKIMLHFWKTYFPKCYEHETWSVSTTWKEGKRKFGRAHPNRHLMTSS